MKGSIRYLATNRDRTVVENGFIEKRQIVSSLRRIEPAAKELLVKSGAEHVIYCAKVFDRFGGLAAIHFFLWPMNEDEFDRATRHCRGAQIYALHRR